MISDALKFSEKKNVWRKIFVDKFELLILKWNTKLRTSRCVVDLNALL